MGLKLGLSLLISDTPLGRRLAWLTAARLVFLLLLLVLVSLVFGRVGGAGFGFTNRVLLVTLAGGFALAAVYAAVLRSGRHLRELARMQLVLDQVTWTVIVYLTGGPSSGATALYGLSCLAGAILLGLKGAGLAAVTAGALHAVLLGGLYLGWLGPPPDQPASAYHLTRSEFCYGILLHWLILGVVTLLSGYLAERLRLARGEIQEAEARAEQAERMAALGRLAAGLAHEIRNPLGSIVGSAQLLQSASTLTAEERQLCAIIRSEAERLNELVTDMTDLARPRRPQLTQVDASAVAREVVALARASGRTGTDVIVAYSGPQRLVIRADPAQLRQLVWNLVRNAVEASTPGDRVDVRLEVVGSQARLLVEDQGPGIDDQAKSRLFDAFFTTRSHGTGIGLAVVKRIADEHGFSVRVESEQGRGATFIVGFGPATDQVPDSSEPL